MKIQKLTKMCDKLFFFFDCHAFRYVKKKHASEPENNFQRTYFLILFFLIDHLIDNNQTH